MSPRRYFIRNLEAPDLFLTFLVSAVGSILAIRFYLHLAGYPQIGGGGLHIAHMLWGGLLMLGSIMLLLGFLNRSAERLAAVLGGVGWGTFIDELGKFITQDHNYFYQPTVALIYVTFVALYVAFQVMTRTATLSDDEYEANAMRVIEDAVVRGLTEDRQSLVREYLSRCRSADPVAVAIGELLRTAESRPAPPPSLFERMHTWVQARYRDVVRHERFRTVLVVFFTAHALLGIWQAVILTDAAVGWVDIPLVDVDPRTRAEWGILASSAFAGLFVILGIGALRRGARMRAYQLFKISVIVAILLTEFFVFLDVQFDALYGFGLNLLVLFALDTLIEHERELRSAILVPPALARV